MATTIDLGHLPSFRLGGVEVRPSRCEVVGEAGRERLEPRVMQVLVALAQADGDTVTRDDLTRLCWNGRIVGDDSINRIILKLRHLSRGLAAGSFTLETIKKVGYRLRVETAEPPSPASTLEGASPRRGLARYGGVVVVALALVSGAIIGLNGVPSVPASRPSPPAAVLEPAARDLAVRGAAAAFEQTAAQQAQAVRYFQAAVEKAPDSSALWGSLALNYAIALPYAEPQEQDRLIDRAQQAARRSLALNPHEGHALAAMTYAEPTFRNWARKERLYRYAVARSDGGSSAPVIHYARFLASVGRTSDALRQAEQAMRAHPLVPWLNVAWIELLAVNGRLDEAERAAARATELWPRNHDLWTTRFFLLALNGATDRAIMLVDDRNGWPEGARPGDMALLRRTAEAIASRSAIDADAVLARYARLVPEGQAYAEQAIRVAAALERPDAALRFASFLYEGADAPIVARRFVDHLQYGRRDERTTAPLFLAPADRLWTDDRFLTLAARIGLVEYWRRAGVPDLCGAVEQTCRRYGLTRTPSATGRAT